MKTCFPNDPVELKVNGRDSDRGIPLDPSRCALAVCGVRTIAGCHRAEIFKTVAYFYFDGRRDKYVVPADVSREIHHYDRAKDLARGTYVLRPVPPSGRKKRTVGTQRGRGGGNSRPISVPNPLVRRRT